MPRPFKKLCPSTECTGCNSLNYIHSHHRWCYEENYGLPTLKPERHQIAGTTYMVMTGMVSNLADCDSNQQDDYQINWTPVSKLDVEYRSVDIILKDLKIKKAEGKKPWKQQSLFDLSETGSNAELLIEK